jgi:hypothetical protein
MSPTTAALRLDERTRGHLFVASTGFPVFALLKATTRHFAKPISKVPCLWSILTNQNCVERPFARHRQTDRCKIFARGSEERKRDNQPAFGEGLVAGAGFEPATFRL